MRGTPPHPVAVDNATAACRADAVVQAVRTVPGAAHTIWQSDSAHQPRKLLRCQRVHFMTREHAPA
ncbi:hypothetical protein XAR_3492 [Xanthomonas citri pv. glycines str. 8ra]|nr:hypothetical protein XAR_3492 [Xanthomonas citri pv. glycines str. 8ra]